MINKGKWTTKKNEKRKQKFKKHANRAGVKLTECAFQPMSKEGHATRIEQQVLWFPRCGLMMRRAAPPADHQTNHHDLLEKWSISSSHPKSLFEKSFPPLNGH